MYYLFVFKRLREGGERSSMLSQLTSYNTTSGNDDFLQPSEKKTIDETREMKEVPFHEALICL